MSSDFYLDQVKKCVSFIFEVTNPPEPLGTGFFVGIDLESGPAIYFITAKHVPQSHGKYRNSVMYRLNTYSTSSEYVVLELSKHQVLTHPDENVRLGPRLYNIPLRSILTISIFPKIILQIVMY